MHILGDQLYQCWQRRKAFTGCVLETSNSLLHELFPGCPSVPRPWQLAAKRETETEPETETERENAKNTSHRLLLPNLVCNMSSLLLYSVGPIRTCRRGFHKGTNTRRRIIRDHLRGCVPPSGLWPPGTSLACTENTQWT